MSEKDKGLDITEGLLSKLKKAAERYGPDRIWVHPLLQNMLRITEDRRHETGGLYKDITDWIRGGRPIVTPEAETILEEYEKRKNAVHMKLKVREACRQRVPLDGAEAQALEHALTITEKERDDAIAREEKAKEMWIDIHRSLAHANGETYRWQRALKAYLQKDLADAPTEEFRKIEDAIMKGNIYEIEKVLNLEHPKEEA